MGHRLSKIYTRTGDDGSTGLGDGSRVPKTHVRIEAYGTVDEANSAIGMVLAATSAEDVRTVLTRIQHELFDLGGELSVPVCARSKTSTLRDSKRISIASMPHCRRSRSSFCRAAVLPRRPAISRARSSAVPSGASGRLRKPNRSHRN